MNHENIQKVINWLNKGAPETVFSMRYGLTVFDPFGMDLADDGYFTLAPSEQKKIDAGNCGSVCCIGGAAAQFGGMAPKKVSTWTEIQNAALEYFGVNPDSNDYEMLPVFDPDEAPYNCSPKQAAKALKLWASQDPKNFDITFNPWPEL